MLAKSLQFLVILLLSGRAAILGYSSYKQPHVTRTESGAPPLPTVYIIAAVFIYSHADFTQKYLYNKRTQIFKT